MDQITAQDLRDARLDRENMARHPVFKTRWTMANAFIDAAIKQLPKGLKTPPTAGNWIGRRVMEAAQHMR